MKKEELTCMVLERVLNKLVLPKYPELTELSVRYSKSTHGVKWYTIYYKFPTYSRHTFGLSELFSKLEDDNRSIFEMMGHGLDEFINVFFVTD